MFEKRRYPRFYVEKMFKLLKRRMQFDTLYNPCLILR